MRQVTPQSKLYYFSEKQRLVLGARLFMSINHI